MSETSLQISAKQDHPSEFAVSASASQPSSLNGSNSIVTDRVFDGYGNLTKVTDPKGIITQGTYDSNSLYLVTKVEASGTSVARTFTYAHDASTGLTTSITDSDNAITTTYGYDALGRPASANEAGLRVTATTYEDANRRVIVNRDQNNLGDGAIVAITDYDQLGRVRLTRQLESSSGNVDDDTVGIKVQTRYLYSGSNSYKLASNPFRAATSSAASSETTMGWSLTQFDQDGRSISTQTFAGTTLPAPFATSGGNSSSTGTVSTSYASQTTTVTDQVQTARASTVDGLGRLVQVTEDPGGTLNYQTTYAYDVLGDLTQVNQASQTRTFSYSSLKRLLSATNPESGTISYTYDPDGNLLTRGDPRGATTTYAYDALHRPTSKSHSPGTAAATPAVTYTYDSAPYGHGRLYSVSNSNSATTYNQYDALGRVMSSTQTTSGTAYPFTYTCNLADALLSETYPSRRVVTTSYDPVNRVSSVTGQTSVSGPVTAYATNFSYASHGEPTNYTYGNGVYRQAAFNSRLQPVSFADYNSSGQPLLALGFAWGGATDNGNLTQATVTTGGNSTFTQNFTYDNVNRLSTASETAASTQSWSFTFGYDQYGNMWVPTWSGSGLPAPPITSNIYTNNFIGTGASYDSAGNQTLVGGNTLTFDAENHQVQVAESQSNGGGTETYVYDGDGKRVQKSGPAGTATFLYDALGRLAGEVDSVATTPTCVTCYLSPDHLGTNRLTTDANGAVTDCHDYLPFGVEIPAGVSGRAGCYSSNFLVDNINQKFTGKERDAESGLDFFEARHFAGSQGRFMSPDPLGGKLVDPQTLNRYAYVRNNPLSLTDPTGLYIVNCTTGSAKDQKNCDKAADSFEKQRQKDLKSKDVKVRDAAAAWGDRGKDNNVNVTFKSQQQVDADANTKPGYTTDAIVTPGTTSDHQPNINAEFSEDLKGRDLGRTIAHEGSHIEDDMSFLKSYDPTTGQYFGGLNFTHFDTEFPAFETGSIIKPYPMFPRGPSGYQQLTDYIYRAYPNANQLVFPPSLYPQGNPPR